MLKIIRTHNYLNGLAFSFVEYAIVIAVLAPFAIYYLAHGRWLYAAIAVGVIANCGTVSVMALAALLRREDSVGVFKIARDRALRRKLKSDHPRLSRETGILSVAVLIPFAILAAVVRDLARRS